MKGLSRTKYCNDFSIEDIGKEEVVAGFVQKVRNMGNLIFVDVRDITGVVQLSFDEKTEESLMEKGASLRTEFVIMAKGVVKKRQSVNAELKTGEIELEIKELHILSKAKTPPFELVEGKEIGEDIRLKYRYLDLRRKEMQEGLKLRHRVGKLTRDYFDENHFIEVETPTFIRSTPEGARDFLIPSRVQPGTFFALPQSPQLYKQLLMVGGYDRYLQFARCYRDEDLRADRQPEFTQIDLEMSFVDQEDVIKMNEGYMAYLFHYLRGEKLTLPLPRMTYEESMNRYGSDKPDIRFGLELQDLSKGLKDSEFSVFSNPIQKGGSVRGINGKGLGNKLSRKEIDKLVEIIKLHGGKGLAFLRLTEESESSSYEKFLTEEEKFYIRNTMKAEKGDVIFLVGDEDNQVVYNGLGALRLELGKRCNLIEEDKFAFLWVTDFPMFEYDKETKRYYAMHHPFTSPREEDIPMLEESPEKAMAQAYDLVLNGTEIGGGSIRITSIEVQEKVFSLLGLSKEESREKFGFLLEAFSYGVPPHGGMAYGFDRLVMLLSGKQSIRDVIAFPKTQNAAELMTQCPSVVGEEQLKELYLKLEPRAK